MNKVLELLPSESTVKVDFIAHLFLTRVNVYVEFGWLHLSTVCDENSGW